MRSYRLTVMSRLINKAKRQGAEELRIKILSRFEGDLANFETNGAGFAEMVRWIGLVD